MQHVSHNPKYPKEIRREVLIAVCLMLPVVILIPFLVNWSKPYLIAFLGTGLLLLAAMAIARHRPLQNVLLLLASVAFCLAVSEFGAGILNGSAPQMSSTLQFVNDDPDLGYSLVPNQIAHERKVSGEKVLFDVSYTINSNGFRQVVLGPVAPDPCRVAFFGDSFMFGWGLEDAETMPAQFVTASGGLYAGYNFANSGYGPHQMLRLLETGRFDRAVDGAPINLVIYQGIVDHVARVVGRNTWDLSGPRYLLTPDKQGVIYAGPFHGATYAAFLQLLNKSDIYSLIAKRFITDRPRAEDVPLFIAILKKARQQIERRYGPGSFAILFWYANQYFGADLEEKFRDAGLNVIPITDAVPDINEKSDVYRLAPEDSHPNAAANHRIAEFLARGVGAQHCGRLAISGKKAN